MLGVGRVERVSYLSAISGWAVVVIAVLAMGVTAGCSSRKKHKSRSPSPITITTTSLPDATEGVLYRCALQATGGNSGNYNWGISGQPPWLSINSSTGELSGTPPTGSAGSYPFTVSVTDGQQTAQVSLSITVIAAPAQLQIVTTSLPDATEGVPYSHTVQATGGNSSNYNWSVSGQPLWLSIDATTGELSGTPPTGSAGSYPFTVSVTDGQQTASKQFDLLVQSGGSGTSLKADFEASPTQGTAPLTVNFTDKSTGSPTSWEWDFDNDGTVDSTQQNPTHTYNDPGWYTVKLTVSDGTSSDICVKEKYVLVASGIYCVDGVGGNDANSGLDWSNAWKTIGKALSVAGDYDLVLVADATYNETDLNFNGKKIYLKGVDHNNAGQQPVIDCQQAGRAFYFGSGETGDCVIDNFTIQNGKVSGTSGGAVLCESNSSPTIKNCVFKDNETESGMWTASGGAIACWDSSDATISGCTFIGNRTVWYGGAIFWHSSDPTVTNCIFKFNNAFHGAAIGCWESTASIINCIFDSNGATNCGGAITCSSSSPTLTNCTFSGNGATNFYGGAISCNFSSPTLNNCILWDDIAGSSGNEIYIKDPGSSCTLNYCCVDNTGYGGQTGNITENNCIHVDPQFVDVLTGDYHLKDTSPCIDAGDNSLVPSSVTTDLDGRKRIVDGDNDGSATVDIGAYEYQP